MVAPICDSASGCDWLMTMLDETSWLGDNYVNDAPLFFQRMVGCRFEMAQLCVQKKCHFQMFWFPYSWLWSQSLVRKLLTVAWIQILARTGATAQHVWDLDVEMNPILSMDKVNPITSATICRIACAKVCHSTFDFCDIQSNENFRTRNG